MEKKKTKLSISGAPKKYFKKSDTSKQGEKKNFSQNRHKTWTSSSSFKSGTGIFKKPLGIKPNFPPKTSSATSDFEKRKLAEQRATKRLKNDPEKDKKNKLGEKKRETKLTVSRALSDEIETRERSLASVKRARQKELKMRIKMKTKNNKKMLREI